MQLIVAEKPSVARDLARVLGVRGGKGADRHADRHAIFGEERVITWCIGHLVELEEPAAYDARWKSWRLETLPMIPPIFKLRPVAATHDQLRAVSGLLRDRRFGEVVNACDAGREGELIFRYLYELAGSRLAVRRLWISSLTDEAIRSGFAGLRPGRDYDPLADAARCRSEADWLVGMNATRALTIHSRRARPAAPRAAPARGRAGREERSPLYSVGRVQTPTLAIVVRREEEIRAFRPRDYWELRGTFRAADGGAAKGGPADDGAAAFNATWSWWEGGGKTRRTRLGQSALAGELVARSRAHGGAGDAAGPVVEHLRQRRVHEPPPLLFDLTSLQRTANRRFGLSAAQTLGAAQALYERHKVITYPRTDARHLPQDVAATLPKIFAALGELPDYAEFAAPLLAAPPPRSRRVFDDAKVHDHHAIIPTGKSIRLDGMERDERRILDLVVRRFLGVFHPDAELAVTEVIIRVGADDTAAPAPAEGGTLDEEPIGALPPPPDRFFARGRVRLVAGWQAVAQIGERADGRTDRPGADGAESRAGAEGEQRLPALHEGQRLHGDFEALAKQTRPPPRHNEASLLGAMEYAGRDIEDEELRAAMRDTGLGTPATRAATIETLLRRKFVVRDGKHLIPTEMGSSLIHALPVASLASPELTGSWEARLARVARAQESRAQFMADIARYVGEVVAAIAGAPAAAPAQARSSASAPPSRRVSPREAAGAPPCPRCREGTLIAGKRGWGCTRWREGCPFVIWFEMAEQRISEVELRDLVKKGRTRRRKWRRPGGETASGRLVLDLAAPREVGAARFEPA